MKKISLVLLAVFCVVLSPLAAASIAVPDIELPVVVDVRSGGMGGQHLADEASPFVLLHNPSLLPLSGKQVLLPSFAMDLGGPAGIIPIFQKYLDGTLMSEENQDMITSILTPLLEDTNGIYIDADIMLPVLGGRVNNGWGWGLYNDVFVRGTIPSLSIANVKAGGDLMLAFGFGFPLIETDNHFLSIGFNTKVLGRMEVVYDGDVSSLTKTDFSQLPAYLYGIAGADVGLTYNLLDILTVSLAWKDFYYGVGKNMGPLTSMSFSANKGVSHNWSCGDLDAGIAVHVPTGFLKFIFSKVTVFADYKNIISGLPFASNAFAEHPLLNLSVGTEVVLFNFWGLRVGMQGPYFSAGTSFDLGPFHLGGSVYGLEKGLDPGESPQLHGALEIAFYY